MDSVTFTFTNGSAIEAAYRSEFFNGHAMIKGIRSLMDKRKG